MKFIPPPMMYPPVPMMPPMMQPMPGFGMPAWHHLTLVKFQLKNNKISETQSRRRRKSNKIELTN